MRTVPYCARAVKRAAGPVRITRWHGSVRCNRELSLSLPLSAIGDFAGFCFFGEMQLVSEVVS